MKTTKQKKMKKWKNENYKTILASKRVKAPVWPECFWKETPIVVQNIKKSNSTKLIIWPTFKKCLLKIN
jgi:hypothetical protein